MAGKPRILIVGGYGAFGQRAAERLAREADIEIIVAGRTPERARRAVAVLSPAAAAELSIAMVDATTPDRATLRSLAPSIIINASGPFQAQDFSLARAAIAIGAHYIDLADAADFVIGFAGDRELDAAAHARGVLVTSGASTVPAISGAVLDHFARAFAPLSQVHYGISPGNSFDPGPATTASIMGALGKAFETRRAGRWVTVHGWQGLSRHRFPTLGRRWMGYCNVPDLKLFAERYPSLQTIEFKAGVEVSAFHLGLWTLSWPSRWGLLRKPERLAAPLLAAKRGLKFLGSDAGGMFMQLGGTGTDGRRKEVLWQLEALSGCGPYIPATPAVVLAKKLVRGEVAARGACACLGLLTLAEIERELAGLDIRTTTS